MASITNVKLKIVGSPTPGTSTVTVTYDVDFNGFDKAADQPYRERITLVGIDNPSQGEDGTNDALTAMLTHSPNFPWPYVARASQIVPPATTLSRSYTRGIANSTLNEDKAGVPNPDEIQAVVKLTPQSPAPVSASSDVVSIAIS
jgi:hypothetical protein